MDRELLKSELVRDEGLRLKAYQDSLGYWTIGVGHLLGNIKRVDTITEPEAYAWLEMDIDEAIMRARKFAPLVEDDEVRWRAIVNMAFNLGDRLGLFRRFLASAASAEWADAATFMLQSLWAKQVGVRAVRLSKMIRDGATDG